MKIEYVPKRFSQSSQYLINRANEIIAEYLAAGYDLTLRQLYYQFVARGYLPNKQSEYSKLGSTINNARLAGYLDWDVIEDRTRSLHAYTHWNSPKEIITACAKQYKIDIWESQPTYIEVWVEKEALAGVVSKACSELRIPYFACRGYVSQSEMWRAAMRFQQKPQMEVLIIHLGDHDPSGIDMTRDIRERLAIFESDNVIVKRIALNMDQIEELNPPPNPAKESDSRFTSYIQKYGHQSWELDALDPSYITRLIRQTARAYMDDDQWEESLEEEKKQRQSIWSIAEKMK